MRLCLLATVNTETKEISLSETTHYTLRSSSSGLLLDIFNRQILCRYSAVYRRNICSFVRDQQNVHVDLFIENQR